MPTYTINGRRIKTDAPLSDDDIDEIAANIKIAAPAAPPKKLSFAEKVAISRTAPLAPSSPAYAKALETGVTDPVVAIRELTGTISPQAVRQREAEYQAAAAQLPGGAGYLRFMGGAGATAPLALVPGAPASWNLLARMGAGAGIGGAAAVLTQPTTGEENFLGQKIGQFGTGAAFGAAAPLVGAGFRKTGDFVNWLRNKFSPETNAQNIIRAAAGSPEKLAAIQAANAAQPNALASQAAAALPDTAQPYQTVVRRAEMEAPDAITAIRAAQTEQHLDTLRQLAGGATQTEAEAARKGTKAALTGITTPMREEAFAEAALPGEVFPVLERKSAEGRAAATAAVKDVRRFTGAIDRAEDWAKDWVASGTTRAPGALPRPPSRYTYPGELAQKAEEVAGTAAEQSLRAGAKARAAENTLASLKSRGLEPLTAAPIVQAIDRKLANPEIALNAKTAPALRRVQQMLQDWTNENGYITPEALYAIRKHGVAGIIEDLMPTASENARKKAAAQIMSEVRPFIDDALGDKFKSYLATFANESKAISQKEMAAYAMQLYENSPSKFRELINGNDPDAVEAIFGGGVRDIKTAMGNKFNSLQKIAADLETEAKISEQAGKGAVRASRILQENLMNARIPNFLSPKITVANEALKGLEGKVNAKTMQTLSRAVQSGANMNELLALVPPGERNRVARAFRGLEPLLQKPYVLNMLVPMSPRNPNQNALAEQ